MPSSQAINKIFYMKGHLSSFEEIDKLRTTNLGEIAREGQSFIAYENSLIEILAKRAQTYYFRETEKVYKVLLVETTVFNSELGNFLSENNKDHDFVITYYFDIPTTTWHFSCRSHARSRLDLGAILKPYGGGGHPKAAGFNVSSPEWPAHLFLTEKEMVEKGEIEEKKSTGVNILQVNEICLSNDLDKTCSHQITLNGKLEIWNKDRIYQWYSENGYPVPVHFM